MAKTIFQSKDTSTLQEIGKMIDKLNYKTDRYSLLSDLFEMTAIGISNQVDLRKSVWNEREERYINLMKKYELSDRQLLKQISDKLIILLSGMCDNGFDDYLGKLYMMSGTSSDRAGQFFTPYSLSAMTAECSIQKADIEKKKANNEIITLNEPAVGSGGMMLAALDVMWNKHGFNYATNCLIDCGDVDTRCVHMCYVQLSLAGVPAVVRHQDALTLKQWDEWHTPALIMQWTRFAEYVR